MKHLKTDKKSHIFAHFVNNENCRALCNENFFQIIVSASSIFRLKLNEAIHIVRKKSSLNKQLKHVTTSITT